MKTSFMIFFFVLLTVNVFAVTTPVTYPWTSHVSEQFVKNSCKWGACGDHMSKTTPYNPFKQRPAAVSVDPEVAAMSAVRKVFKAQFGKEADDAYVLKESKLMVQKGYPQDKYAEEMLRAAYKKNPSLYIKHAKKITTSNQGYSKYGKMRLSGGSVFSSGGTVGVSLG
ncbi:MAG: hypothetical protein AABX70_00645 [Nanoarchaeota archaeon]